METQLVMPAGLRPQVEVQPAGRLVDRDEMLAVENDAFPRQHNIELELFAFQTADTSFETVNAFFNDMIATGRVGKTAQHSRGKSVDTIVEFGFGYGELGLAFCEQID